MLFGLNYWKTQPFIKTTKTYDRVYFSSDFYGTATMQMKIKSKEDLILINITSCTQEGGCVVLMTPGLSKDIWCHV